MYTARFTELAYPLLTSFADQQVPGTLDSNWVSLSTYHRAFLLFNLGDTGPGATCTVSLRQAQDTTGTGAKAITGKQLTQFTQPGDMDELCGIELRTEELDVNNDFDCVQVRVVITVSGVEMAYTLFGLEPRFAAVPTTNWTEIVD
jgi:hypothetical protein